MKEALVLPEKGNRDRHDSATRLAVVFAFFDRHHDAVLKLDHCFGFLLLGLMSELAVDAAGGGIAEIGVVVLDLVVDVFKRR